MSWHYQIRKRVDQGEEWFDIVEVYGPAHLGWSEDSARPEGGTREEVIKTLEMMLDDAKKYPVLEDISEQSDWHQLHKGVGE